MKIIFVIFTSLLLTVPVQAEKTESPFASEAIDWCMSEGISNGVSSGNYGADMPTNWWQVRSMCCRAFNRHDTAKNMTPAKLDDVCAIVLESAGVSIWPSPRRFDQEAVDICKMCGIIPLAEDASRWATRRDVAEILYRVATGRYVIPEAPINIEVEPDFLKHELQSCLFLLELQKLPDCVLDAYDGVLVIGDDDLLQYEKNHGRVATGVYWPRTKRITVCDTWSLLHEFGHFWEEEARSTGVSSRFFRTESGKLAVALNRDYCKTNPSEFYAEAFKFYFRDPEALRICAPNIFWEIQSSLI